MRIYLDLCCYNRPYDEQDNIIVRLESDAKLFIQGLIRDRQLELVWSSMLDYENKDNPSDEKRERIAVWKKMAVVSIRMSDTIQKTAAHLATLGIKNNDAIHIACAIEAHADYFITTDKRILNKPVEKIITINPLNFLERYEDDNVTEK
jgi:predicted nucleic acid-binding protein